MVSFFFDGVRVVIQSPWFAHWPHAVAAIAHHVAARR
jgi:hypothetical protein